MDAEWRGMMPISGDVVVVEDDTVLRPLMVEILSGMRARVISFSTADDALMHVLDSHGHCSLLITDHSVPGQILGTELAEMFRAKWPKVPVIITSGHELFPETIPAGVAYLQKPWAVDQLVETIAKLLQPGLPISRLETFTNTQKSS